MHIKKNDLFYQRQFHAVIVLLNTYVFIGTALICINMVLNLLENISTSQSHPPKISIAIVCLYITGICALFSINVLLKIYHLRFSSKPDNKKSLTSLSRLNMTIIPLNIATIIIVVRLRNILINTYFSTMLTLFSLIIFMSVINLIVMKNVTNKLNMHEIMAIRFKKRYFIKIRHQS